MANSFNVVQLGIQGPPGPISASVANPAALGSLDALGSWQTGTVAYEQTGKNYWTLDRKSTATPNGTSVVAANGGGNWVLWSTQWSSPTVPVPTVAGQVLTAAGSPLVPTWAASGGILSVATRAALSATADASLPDGQPAFNEESLYRANWQLDKTSTLTADGVTVLATQSGTGRWILSSRIAGTVPVTEVGADPTGASDSLAAFNAIITALNGTGVSGFIPGGTYDLSAAPTNASAIRWNLGLGVTFTGAGGSTMQAAASAGSPMLATQGDLTQGLVTSLSTTAATIGVPSTTLSFGSLTAQSGYLRFPSPNGGAIVIGATFRNNANSADVYALSYDNTDNLYVGDGAHLPSLILQANTAINFFINGANTARITASSVTFLQATIALNGLTTSTTSPAAGGAGALPATPKGYFPLTINGTAQQVPYY